MTDFPPPPPPNVPPPPPPGGFGAPPPPPGYTTTYGDQSAIAMSYAGFWARFAAMLLDGIITGLLFIPAVIAIAAGPKRITTCSVDSDGYVTVGGEINSLCEVPTGGAVAIAVLLGLAAVAGAVLYYVRLEGGPRGQTLGKKALGIRTVDATTGGPIGSGRALGRLLFKSFISGSICYLGYLWMLWDKNKQTWHDKVVTSVVIKA